METEKQIDFAKSLNDTITSGKQIIIDLTEQIELTQKCIMLMKDEIKNDPHNKKNKKKMSFIKQQKSIIKDLNKYITETNKIIKRISKHVMKNEDDKFMKTEDDEFMKWLETQPIYVSIHPQRKSDEITDKFYDFLFDIIMWIAPRRYKCLFAAILFVVLMLFVVYFLII